MDSFNGMGRVRTMYAHKSADPRQLEFEPGKKANRLLITCYYLHPFTFPPPPPPPNPPPPPLLPPPIHFCSSRRNHRSHRLIRNRLGQRQRAPLPPKLLPSLLLHSTGTSFSPLSTTGKLRGRQGIFPMNYTHPTTLPPDTRDLLSQKEVSDPFYHPFPPIVVVIIIIISSSSSSSPSSPQPQPPQPQLSFSHNPCRCRWPC